MDLAWDLHSLTLCTRLTILHRRQGTPSLLTPSQPESQDLVYAPLCGSIDISSAHDIEVAQGEMLSELANRLVAVADITCQRCTRNGS